MEQQNGVIYEEVSDDELLEELDREARRRLGMSGEEFAEKYRRGELPNTLATTELGILLRFANRSLVPA